MLLSASYDCIPASTPDSLLERSLWFPSVDTKLWDIPDNDTLHIHSLWSAKALTQFHRTRPFEQSNSDSEAMIRSQFGNFMPSSTSSYRSPANCLNCLSSVNLGKRKCMFPSEFGTWNESGNKNRRGVVSLPVLVIRIAKARGKKKKSSTAKRLHSTP